MQVRMTPGRAVYALHVVLWERAALRNQDDQDPWHPHEHSASAVPKVALEGNSAPEITLVHTLRVGVSRCCYS